MMFITTGFDTGNFAFQSRDDPDWPAVVPLPVVDDPHPANTINKAAKINANTLLCFIVVPPF
jgi:hypothetical protein